MIFLLLLIATELLAPAALRQHFYHRSKAAYYILVIAHFVLSFWFWILFIAVTGDHGPFDSPRHVWSVTHLAGMISGVIIPRTILVIAHFTGRLIRYKSGGHISWLTNTGLIISSVIFMIIAAGTLHGRFNFRTDRVEVRIKDLNPDLDGLKIVQLSDLHLAGFYHHRDQLAGQMEAVNRLEPDLLLNTGDFVTFGWREFDNFDTVLSKANGKYGNFAVLGNHDFGTYHPDYTQTDRANNVLRINQLVKSSGYLVLNDEHMVVSVKGAKIGIIGITTMGRHPDIVHGDLDKAIMDLDSVDLQILLSHDPNQWELAVAGKTDIDLTLSGHTHGMQMGIYTEKVKWSPSKYYYPHWSGLFSKGDQYHYVNRGLGVLAIPFRICMPPEITLITLKRE
ncbi:MAG: metallophosphoesterase [Bacteroidetes bacterium]|nr:metallophosphoesterase [Bacteroidota bacterium]